MRDCKALSLMSKPHPEPLRNSSLPVISVLPAVLFVVFLLWLHDGCTQHDCHCHPLHKH